MAGRAQAWVRLGRPHFLVGGVAFHVLGALLAQAGGHTMTLAAFALSQLLVTVTQLGVHFGNEWHDLAADRANRVRTRFAGGSRVLVEGGLPPEAARNASRVAFGLALLLAASATALHGAAAGVVAALMIALSWAYSAPPLRLHSRGVGGLTAGLVVAGLVPALAVLVAGARLDAAFAIAVAPPGLQVAALVGALSLPDAAGDAATGKRTLAVRIGPRKAGRLLQVAWIAAGLLTLASIALGRPPYVALAAGSGLALAVAFPVLAGTRRWDALALGAAGLVALQWVLTVCALVS